MKDRYNREISYMRISITDRCNLRCQYCMPEDGITKLKHSDILTFDEIVNIVKISTKLGIKKIRLTGGEPLVRKGVVDLCREISAIDGIEELAITTNGSFLYDMAEDLKNAGVKRINLSLDTLDPEKYSYITRGGKIEDVLKGLEKAIELGFNIKVNSVLVGGFNYEDAKALAELGKDHDIQVRFIELMKLGETRTWDKEKFISNFSVLDEIPNAKNVGTEGVAKIYKIPGYKGTIGFISPVSSCFCEDCNRIRLTSDGKLKPCLHSNVEVNLRGLADSEIERVFRETVFNKPKSHHLKDGYTETDRNMNAIGG